MKRKTNSSDIIKKLNIVARNLWWSWNPRAQAIFEELSSLIWETSNHNPIAVLSQVSESELKAKLGDKIFFDKVISVIDSFEKYIKRKPLCQRTMGVKKLNPVAYFCAEFGLHECLPFYSGGLGVLAGDHIKSASDLGIPLVGVGLFYRQGYFKQQICSNGCQVESYPTTNPKMIPVELVVDRRGKPVICNVMIGNNLVYFQAWRVNVGRCCVFLLDTFVPENEEEFRGLTALAYGGDNTTRIRQEMVLGIGGVKLLRALNIKPSVFHLNEGHAAFVTLELLREHLLNGLSKPEAEIAVRKQCVFTTHTPVPAGHDHFPKDLISMTLRPYLEEMRITIDEMMEYGNTENSIKNNEFIMTVLAMKLSKSVNAVSKKHAEVSRLMWLDLYDVKDAKKVPIGHITNGVHIPSWTSRTSWEFWERHNSHQWKEQLNDPKFWHHVSNPSVVTDEELWALRYELRRELIEFIRKRAFEHKVIGGVTGEEALSNLLSFDALTIGFARRFAPYKRAPLIFSDLVRAAELFNDTKRPIQIIFSGKAHPKDGEGKEFLRQIIEITRKQPFQGKVVFIENYDMNVARHMIAGCDLWLNTPRRPLEASGTSGEKVAINGGLQVSILDGWWNDAYNGENGWAIGKHTNDNLPVEEINRQDAASLYRILSKEIIPLFYKRDKYGIPRGWLKKIRCSMKSIIPVYNTHRMVTEYAKKYYNLKKK